MKYVLLIAILLLATAVAAQEQNIQVVSIETNDDIDDYMDDQPPSGSDDTVDDPDDEKIAAVPVHMDIDTEGDEVPETTGIEHENIGIADPDPENAGVDVFIKMEDIDGESQDGDPDRPVITGNVPNDQPEVGDEVLVAQEHDTADGHKDEIDILSWNAATNGGTATIKGKKILENDRPVNPAILQKDVETPEELIEFAEATVAADRNIEEVTITFEEIKVSYSYPAKLFGFINVDYTAETHVDETGRVKVKFPWWLALSKDTSSELEHEMQTVGEDAQLANIDLQNKLQKQQQTLQTISNVAKMQHDTAMAVIRKIG